MGPGLLRGATLFIAAALVVLGATYLLARAVDTPGDESEPDAMGVLEQRYARGEIDDETFEERRIRLSERDRS